MMEREGNKMEFTSLICDTTLCRLCAEENNQGCELFINGENEDLSDLINRYLPIKVENDDKFPKKICPGCNIQLEATKSFMDLIVDGQAKLRHLYKTQQEKLNRQEKQRLQLEEVLKSVNPASSVDTYTIESDETGEKFLIQIVSEGPLFPPDHDLALKAEGLTKPKRKRGRPPKAKTFEEPTPQVTEPSPKACEDITEGGRRRRKVPLRFMGAIAGKELDKVFKQEGVIDEESFSSSDELSTNMKRGGEVIGRLQNEEGEDLGQQIYINSKVRPKRKIKRNNRRRRYQCEVCKKEFLHHGRYEVHRRLHEVEFSCDEDGCDFVSGDKSKLDAHQTESGHKEFKTVERIEKYGTLHLPTSVVLSPLSTVTQKKDFACPQCAKTFTCKQNFEVHLKAVHEGLRLFGCDVCSKTFSYASSLRIHRLKHTKIKRKVLSRTGDIRRKDGQYRCLDCPKVFHHPSSLQYHRETQHTNGRRFVCNTCNKSFRHRQLLQRHQLVHTEERPHICEECGTAFKTRHNLGCHLQTVHASAKNHFCEQCGKSFGYKSALMGHLKWHEGVRPYKCEICQKTFSQKGNLAEHVRIHTGEKPFQCDQCKRSFTTSSQMTMHKRRHTNERPHKCPNCDKAFPDTISLKYHYKRHFDTKKYKCDICDKGFSEPWSVKKHQRSHTGEKPYSCELCSKSFSDSSNLSKHRKIHERNKEPKLIIAENTEKMGYVTYDIDNTNAIITYMEPESEPLISANDELVMKSGETVQLQQLVDQEGNPISFTTQDGQQVNVVTSTEDGEDNIQGLLPDGTLVPISLSNEKGDDYEVGKLDESLLPSGIEFLEEDDEGSKMQFIGDNQNILVTTYNIDDGSEFMGL